VLSDEAVEAKRHRRRAERRHGRSGLSSDKRRTTQRWSASSRNCSKRQVTSEPHGALRSHCCTADRRLCTTTRNARTSSASSVCSSSTRSDASRTTSRRGYSSPAPGCSLHDRLPDPNYQFSSWWLSMRSGSCWRPYHARYRCWTSCLSLYWSDVFVPAITTLANLSLQTGKFPARLKSAQVLPLLKITGLDRSLPVNYRPISNLSTVSKVLERLVLAGLRPHLTNSTNFSKRQSAYRQGHSTETALPDVLDSVHTAADNKKVTLLIGLDLSAAFDTVCHSTLTQRLHTEFGVSGTALSWIQSYLQDRTQFVKLGQHRSSETTQEVRVPQESVLGPLLFAVYCSPVSDVIASHGVRCHQYADDTQLHLAMRVDNTAAGLSILAACTTDVKEW